MRIIRLSILSLLLFSSFNALGEACKKKDGKDIPNSTFTTVDRTTINHSTGASSTETVITCTCNSGFKEQGEFKHAKIKNDLARHNAFEGEGVCSPIGNDSTGVSPTSWVVPLAAIGGLTVSSGYFTYKYFKLKASNPGNNLGGNPPNNPPNNPLGNLPGNNPPNNPPGNNPSDDISVVDSSEDLLENDIQSIINGSSADVLEDTDSNSDNGSSDDILDDGTDSSLNNGSSDDILDNIYSRYTSVNRLGGQSDADFSLEGFELKPLDEITIDSIYEGMSTSIPTPNISEPPTKFPHDLPSKVFAKPKWKRVRHSRPRFRFGNGDAASDENFSSDALSSQMQDINESLAEEFKLSQATGGVDEDMVDIMEMFPSESIANPNIPNTTNSQFQSMSEWNSAQDAADSESSDECM